MSCQFLDSRSPLERRWHLLRCPECRAAHAVDATLDRGLKRLKAEAAPADGITRTLNALGLTQANRTPRSRRWKAILRRSLMPTGATVVLAAGAWLCYIDITPVVHIPTPTMPAHNAYDTLNKAGLLLHEIKDTDMYRQAGGDPSTTAEQIRKLHALLTTHFIITSRSEPAPLPAQKEVLFRRHLLQLEVQLHAEQAGMLRAQEVEIHNNAAALALVRQALQEPYQAPPARSASTLFPEFAKDRALARMLLLEARVRQAHGDVEGAVNSRLDAMQMGAQLPHGSLMIGKLVGIACEAIGRNGMWKLVDRLDAAQARAATRRMEQIVQLHVPMSDTLREEKWLQQATLLETFRQRRWRTDYVFAGTSQSPPLWNPGGMRLYLRLLPYSKSRILNDVTTIMDRIIADTRQPYCARQLTADPAMTQIIQAHWDPLIDMLMPMVTQAGFQDTAGCDVQDRLLLVTLALRAYHEEHHAYPETLNALTPDYLTAVPADPFVAGQPLRYYRTGAKYVLYSVGPDGKDDHGKPIDDRTFYMFASPEQREAKRYAMAPNSKGDILAGVNYLTNGSAN